MRAIFLSLGLLLSFGCAVEDEPEERLVPVAEDATDYQIACAEALTCMIEECDGWLGDTRPNVDLNDPDASPDDIAWTKCANVCIDDAGAPHESTTNLFNCHGPEPIDGEQCDESWVSCTGLPYDGQ